MPEGDTVHLAAARVRRALEGSVLTRTDFRVPALATLDLSGRRLDEVVARGKHLLFRVEGGFTIHSHFKMEGAWHVYERGARWRAPGFQARAILEDGRVQVVGFRLGILEVLTREEEADAVGHLGPDVLGPDWDEAEVLRRMRAHPEMEIGEAVLDQRIVSGPGNVYKSEVCFLRGVHPRTPVGGVPDLVGFVRLLKRLMEANRATGRQITTGDTRPGRQRWVYGREGGPCRRCRTPISAAESPGYGGARITFWCPNCQPER